VRIACLAQLVNVIAPIMTSERTCWTQTIYWPFLHASQYGRGTAIQPIIHAPLYSSKDFDDVPMIDAAAIHDDGRGLHIFVLNRSIENDITLSCDLRAFGDIGFVEHILLHHDNIKAVNTETKPEQVVPVVRHQHEAENGKFIFTLPALSWNVLRFSER
jgi:alpha-N-arabinofuranosidase